MKQCECGCGQPAPIATFSHKRRGYVKGQPKRFIRGHNPVPTRYRFSAEDCGNGCKRGYRYTNEYKERMRQAKLARGFKGPTYGMKMSEATKAMKRRIAIENNHAKHLPPKGTGPNSAHWKGGKESYQKRQALKRDDYTCQVCGLRDEEIATVDHIKPKALYPELTTVLDNLQTLCPNCHARKSNEDKREIVKVKRSRLQCG